MCVTEFVTVCIIVCNSMCLIVGLKRAGGGACILWGAGGGACILQGAGGGACGLEEEELCSRLPESLLVCILIVKKFK